jgi:hypothetical protein
MVSCIQFAPKVGSNTSTVALRVVGGDEKEVSNLRMTTLARTSSNCKRQPSRPRQRQRPILTNSQQSDSNKNLVASHRYVLDTKTDWPTDCRS